jgi:hypothetical protein
MVRRLLRGPQPDLRDTLPGWPSSSKSHLAIRLLRIDWVGAFLCVVGAILVLIGLSWGSTESWNQAKVIAMLTVGVSVLVVLIVWEYYVGLYEVRFGADEKPVNPSKPLRIPPPLIKHTQRMLPLYIFKSHQIDVLFLSGFTSGMLMFGAFYFLAIYYRIVAGYEGTKSGTQLTYFAPGLGGGVWLWSLIVRTTRQVRACPGSLSILLAY